MVDSEVCLYGGSEGPIGLTADRIWLTLPAETRKYVETNLSLTLTTSTGTGSGIYCCCQPIWAVMSQVQSCRNDRDQNRACLFLSYSTRTACQQATCCYLKVANRPL